MKKRGFALSVFFLLIFVLTALTVPAETEKKMSKKAEKLMVKALDAINQKQPDQAIELLNQVAALAPENAVVHHYLGVLLYQKGKNDEAIASFEEALRLQNDYQKSLLALRQALFEAGKSASGQKDYEKSTGYLLKLEGLFRPQEENKGLLAFAYYVLGENFFNLKQFPKAIEYFSKCQSSEGLEKEDLELYAEATFYLGMMNHIQGQYAISNEHFQKYLALYPGGEAKPKFFTNANYFIGANLFRQLEEKMAKGDVAKMNESAAEILPYLTIAVENKIPDEDAYVKLGNCYIYLKDYTKAAQVYQQLIELFPQSLQLKNYQVFMQELQKMQQQAETPKKKR